MGDVILAKRNGQMVKVLVDEEDFAEVSKKRWYIGQSKGAGVKTNGYSSLGVITSVYLPRLLLNAQPGEYVDHVNGDNCDNRKENLRITTNQQNCENRHGPYSNNTSGYRGVSYDQHHKKYEAYYWRHYKKYSVGFFENKEDAAAAVTLERRANMKFSEMDKIGAAKIVSQALEENGSFLDLFKMAA